MLDKLQLALLSLLRLQHLPSVCCEETELASHRFPVNNHLGKHV